jgi:hypothetical protein
MFNPLVIWRRLATVVFLLCAGAAHAQTISTVIFQCVGADGRVMLRNLPPNASTLHSNCTTRQIKVTQPMYPQYQGAQNDPQPAHNAVLLNAKIPASTQQTRDMTRFQILNVELIQAQSRLAQLQTVYKNGVPDRLGDEKNYQKYQTRALDLKQQINQTQDAVAALEREISREH